MKLIIKQAKFQASFKTPKFVDKYLQKIKRYNLRKYKEGLRKYSLEEIKLIGKGRKVNMYPFPFINNKEQLEKFLKQKTGLEIKTEYVQDEEMKSRKPNLIQGTFGMDPSIWVCYARSGNCPHKNLDLWLKIGKMDADYLFRCAWAGSDIIQRYIGIPLKKID